MTTPAERSRSLRFAGEVLGDVMRDPVVPEALRHQARVTLRHYPAAAEIAAMARIETKRAATMAHPLFPAWLAPEDGQAECEADKDVPSQGEVECLTNLLKHVRQCAWIAYAEGRTLEDKDAALHEILKLTREVGNEPPERQSSMKA